MAKLDVTTRSDLKLLAKLARNPAWQPHEQAADILAANVAALYDIAHGVVPVTKDGQPVIDPATNQPKMRPKTRSDRERRHAAMALQAILEKQLTAQAAAEIVDECEGLPDGPSVELHIGSVNVLNVATQLADGMTPDAEAKLRQLIGMRDDAEPVEPTQQD